MTLLTPPRNSTPMRSRAPLFLLVCLVTPLPLSASSVDLNSNTAHRLASVPGEFSTSESSHRVSVFPLVLDSLPTTFDVRPSDDGEEIPATFLWSSIALTVVDLPAAYFALTRPSQAWVTIGLIGGVAALAVASNHLRDTGNSKSLAQATLAVGAMSVGIALWRAVTPSRWMQTVPLGPVRRIAAGSSLSVVPLPSGGVAPAVAWRLSTR